MRWRPRTLWSSLWPVLLGSLLFALLRRWEHRLPHVPEGDVVILVERSGRWGAAWGEWFERPDAVLCRWPVAGVALLAITAVLGALIVGGASPAPP